MGLAVLRASSHRHPMMRRRRHGQWIDLLSLPWKKPPMKRRFRRWRLFVSQPSQFALKPAHRVASITVVVAAEKRYSSPPRHRVGSDRCTQKCSVGRRERSRSHSSRLGPAGAGSIKDIPLAASASHRYGHAPAESYWPCAMLIGRVKAHPGPAPDGFQSARLEANRCLSRPQLSSRTTSHSLRAILQKTAVRIGRCVARENEPTGPDPLWFGSNH